MLEDEVLVLIVEFVFDVDEVFGVDGEMEFDDVDWLVLIGKEED